MKFRRGCALLLAGSFFCCGCAVGRVKSGVTIGGVEVGGLTYAEAEARVREELEARYLPLVVRTPAGDFSAALDYSDDVGALVRSARRGETYEPRVTREWADAEARLEEICAANARESEDARLTFSADGFSYEEGKRGVACDYGALLSDCVEALKGEGTEISLRCRETEPRVGVEELKARTAPLSEFSTGYDVSNAARAGNIALAASRLTGTVIEAGEIFSFNECVGARTRENGFGEAPVIYDGEFVQGVGGGVCQASTTLFGAALRAGLEIVESHPHSLAVGYVPPSEDAMVSSSSDLVLRNPFPTPVYLLGGAEDGRVHFAFYGLRGEIAYTVESAVLSRVPPPAAQIVEGKQNRTLRAAKEGIVSESYLLAYGKDGVLLSRTRIRRDVYAPVRGILERVPAPDTPETILSSEDETP